MNEKLVEIANENKPTPSPMAVDALWLISIGVVMASSGIWTWLSPRPEVGQVSVLWLPNAILVVALLRNWGRHVFSVLAVAIFLGVGLVPAFQNNSVLGALVCLCMLFFSKGPELKTAGIILAAIASLYLVLRPKAEDLL